MTPNWLRLFAPAPEVPRIQDARETDRLYRAWRLRILYSSMIGYALFYFVRKNLAVAMPEMESSLGISKTDLGLFLTLHGVLYGVSKFANGFLGDRTNPRYFMVLGLMASAVANIFFGLSGSVLTFGLIWLLNGWFQGMGFPPCARSLTHWFSPRERGIKFSIWNTSHSIGAALVLILCAHLISWTGNWRMCFWVPAALALVGAAFLFNRLRDTPQSLGLPPVEQYRGEHPENSTGKTESARGEFKRILVNNVFKNPMIWMISFANFFVYTVRYAILDWGPTMLIQAKGVNLKQAGWYVAGYELAGIAGMLVSGWMMDKVFHGRGARACFFYMLLCGGCVFALWKLPGGATVQAAVVLCAAGFFIYGPQCLVGVIAANLATKRAAATAIGLTGFFGYLSTVASGWGLGKLVEISGWHYGFYAMIASTVIAALLFAVAWNAYRPNDTCVSETP